MSNTTNDKKSKINTKTKPTKPIDVKIDVVNNIDNDDNGYRTKTKNKKPYRHNKYYTHVKPYLEQIKAWCRNGATDKIICEKLGISNQAFCEYKNLHMELVETLKTKDEIDDLVENALLKRALGYDVEEVTEEFDEKNVLVKRKTVTKHIVPDVTAQIYWTKNRRPDRWVNSDRIEIQQSKEQMDIHRELINTIKQRNTLDKKLESE